MDAHRQTCLLEARGLTRCYGAVTVVSDVSLRLAPGEALGVLGPNGAGKTTLLKLLTGDVKASAGQVLWHGGDITALPQAARCRAGIVRTSQIPQPFEGLTVWENVLTAALHGGGRHGEAAEDAAYEALRRTRLLDRQAMPAGRLSLMGRKRLELSRALACDPMVLLLDEIAGGLSDFEVHDLVALIREINASGVAIIWIEHIVHALISVATRLVALDFGRMLAEGAPQDVLNSEAFKRAYFGDAAPIEAGI
ncbi:ABC transporter ATP-binding protein [Rhizobium sp. ACO-34A]|nr:ATP-binding cassette domain-containing protein [Rhizobium sp. ACO-34A]ATN32285.1 ABC transporter ATP-binding protein [Rhizobium sp. ACO-34A]